MKTETQKKLNTAKQSLEDGTGLEGEFKKEDGGERSLSIDVYNPQPNKNYVKYQCFRDVKWRRERDSNPRYGFPHTRFPSVRLQPLGHLSKMSNIYMNGK